MPSLRSTLSTLSLLTLLTLTTATPSLTRRGGFSCDTLASGLSKDDCTYMSKIGMFGQGLNAASSNDKGVWLGDDGPNKFIFQNSAGVGVTLILWQDPPSDYSASMMGAKAPAVSYSLAEGKSVTVSIANGITGGYAGLYDHKTTLNMPGQVFNTWGEFTTGQYGTVDVSREPNMGGNGMKIVVGDGKCTADLTHCSYVCTNNQNTCYTAGTYELIGCTGENTNKGKDSLGQDSGGCTGFENGGTVTTTFEA